MRAFLFAVTSLLLTACGPVIGDACTVNTECGPGVCVNRSYAPGGLCSRVCTVGGPACPAGSACVARAIDGDTAGCLHVCGTDADCRTGYTCQGEEAVTLVDGTPGRKVCAGPGGL